MPFKKQLPNLPHKQEGKKIHHSSKVCVYHTDSIDSDYTEKVAQDPSGL